MATAKVHEGRAIVAYVNGVAVDSNGEAIEGAPKQPKDTDPSQQPHALAQLNTEERSAAILANAFAGALKKAAAADDDEFAGKDDLPTVADLPDHLAGITDIAELKAMRRADERVTARPIYDARIAELEAK